MKFCMGGMTWTMKPRRTPHGVRGLKWVAAVYDTETTKSHPSRGAWIEIPIA